MENKTTRIGKLIMLGDYTDDTRLMLCDRCGRWLRPPLWVSIVSGERFCSDCSTDEDSNCDAEDCQYCTARYCSEGEDIILRPQIPVEKIN